MRIGCNALYCNQLAIGDPLASKIGWLKLVVGNRGSGELGLTAVTFIAQIVEVLVSAFSVAMLDWKGFASNGK